MKKILFLINNLGTGGAETVFLRQAQLARENGYELCFCILNKGDRLPENLKKEITDLGFKGIFSPSAYKRLHQKVINNDIQVIYSCLDKANKIARLYSIFNRKIKVVIRESGMADRKTASTKFFDWFLNIRVEKIIAVSDEVKASLEAYQAKHRAKIVVIGNGVDILLEEKEIENILRAKAGNLIRVLNVGSMDNGNKGQDGIIRVIMSLLSEGRGNLQLVLVGDGKKRLEYMALAKQLNLDDRVEFLGVLDKNAVKQEYQKSHIFVLNSKNEGSPNAVLEAMSFALPIIATQVGGTNKMVEEGKNGFIVKNEAELKERLADLANNAEARKTYGLYSYAKAKKELGFKQQNEQLLRLFKEL